MYCARDVEAQTQHTTLHNKNMVDVLASETSY